MLNTSYPTSLPVGETDAQAPVRAEEWVWERTDVKACGDAFLIKML